MKALIVFFCVLSLSHGTAPEARATAAEHLTSNLCQQETEEYFSAMQSGKNVSRVWRRLMDSTGFPTIDILRGVETWPGSYENCMKMSVSRYCMATFSVAASTNAEKNDSSISKERVLSVGVCVPKSCSSDDLPRILDRLSTAHPSAPLLTTMGISTKLKVTLTRCYPRPEEQGLPLKGAVFWIFMAFLVLVAFLATAAELLQVNHLIHFKSILSCFSLTSNAKYLFSTKHSPECIQILHPLRVIAIVTLIYGHTNSQATYKAANMIEMLQSLRGTWLCHFMLTIPLHVDTFFVMSGLLVSHALLTSAHKLSKAGPAIYMALIIKRYMRITPLYAFVIWLRVAAYDSLSSSPLWFSHGKVIVTEADDCASVYWQNLLYLNNVIYDADSFCLGHSWYLANDMQFFVCALLIAIPFISNARRLRNNIATLIAGSVVITFALCYAKQANQIVNLKNLETFSDRFMQNFTTVYIKPYCRFGAYGVGMWLGIILHRKNTSLQSSKRSPIVMTSLAFFMLLLPMVITYYVDLNELEGALYTSLVRICWATGISILIYASYSQQRTMKGHFMSRLCLSARWVPLSRLTYCVYLVHALFVKFYFTSLSEPVEWTRPLVLYLTMVFIAVSFMSATILYLLVQRPADRLWMLCEERLSGKLNYQPIVRDS